MLLSTTKLSRKSPPGMLVAVGQDAFCVGVIDMKENWVPVAVVVSELEPLAGFTWLALLAHAPGMAAKHTPAATKDAVPIRLMLVRSFLMMLSEFPFLLGPLTRRGVSGFG